MFVQTLLLYLPPLLSLQFGPTVCRIKSMFSVFPLLPGLVGIGSGVRSRDVQGVRGQKPSWSGVRNSDGRVRKRDVSGVRGQQQRCVTGQKLRWHTHTQTHTHTPRHAHTHLDTHTHTQAPWPGWWCGALWAALHPAQFVCSASGPRAFCARGPQGGLITLSPGRRTTDPH